MGNSIDTAAAPEGPAPLRPAPVRREDRRRSGLASLLLLAAGGGAAFVVTLVLWAAPPSLDGTRAGLALCMHAAELSRALLTGDEPATLRARARAQAELDQLQALGIPGGALAAARARWAAVGQALDGPDVAGAVAALAALQPAAEALAEAAATQEAERVRQRDLLLAASSMLAGGVVIWAGLRMRQQRHTLRRLVHQASADLGSGSWQSAVEQLRDDRLGAPSAFDALAAGVEEALGESERRWQTLADLAADWYWETDGQHRLAWMSGNGPLIGIDGVRPVDLLGRRHDEIELFDAPADGWARLHAQLDARRAFRNMEFRVRAPAAQGEVLWVSISGRPRVDAQGRFAGYEGVGRDITDRKLSHEQLRASDQRWALMAGLASDYYWETDTEHRMQPLRPEVARRFGSLAEHSEDRTPWEAFPDAMGADAWADYRADIEARRPYHGVELDIDIGGGRRRIVSISGIPRFDGGGRFLGYHGIGSDITMQREAERLLLRHNETLQRAVAERTLELEQINRDLEAFSRELAHELRTPIGHVQGLAHLLVTKAGDRLASDEMQLVGLQLQAARHMRETVDALLMLARSTVQPLVAESLDLSALAREVVQDLPPLERAAPVDWQIEPGLHVHASPAAIKIVLTNLLGNAAKFTRQVDAPQVTLTGQEGPGGRLRVRIEDNGAGFDMAQAPRLFKPFGRLHSGEQFQGTGIGLTTVQRIVERHGGSVAAQGLVGVGAWFEFTLPTDAT